MTMLKKTSLLLLAMFLAGCAANNAPTRIYAWENYENTLYQYYTSENSPQEQIAALNKLIETARATNKQVPPGVHAQLGLLYSKTGQMELAVAEFNAEKTQFPESATYMDFLLSKFQGAVK